MSEQKQTTRYIDDIEKQTTRYIDDIKRQINQTKAECAISLDVQMANRVIKQLNDALQVLEDLRMAIMLAFALT